MDNYVSISALQHFAYCRRQFALIHVEQVWAENRFTAEGRLLHERVDSGNAEQRGKLRYERSVQVQSERYQLRGKMDLLEIEQGEPTRYFPVEYKRGKPKLEEWDKIQLCAQALCIEEMKSVVVTEGAIWYWETRQRQVIVIDETLRNTTIDVIQNALEILREGKTPPPTTELKRCRACSLYNLCEPNVFRDDWSGNYVSGLEEQDDFS